MEDERSGDSRSRWGTTVAYASRNETTFGFRANRNMHTAGFCHKRPFQCRKKALAEELTGQTSIALISARVAPGGDGKRVLACLNGEVGGEVAGQMMHAAR